MLQHTFIHIPGIGTSTERKLWANGVCTWTDAAEFCDDPSGTLRGVDGKLRKYVPETFRAVRERDTSFFDRLSRFGESWRMFGEFANECVYIDIETTGLSPYHNEITVVGTFDGKDFRVFVRGQNLRNLSRELKKYSIAVTFNGSSFDLPFLRGGFAQSLPSSHIDVRWAVYKLGYRGGLKDIEREFGVKRARRIADMDGFDAVILWDRYRRGDKYALERLIEYNRADVVNLKVMMERCYQRLADRHAKLFSKSRRAFAAER